MIELGLPLPDGRGSVPDVAAVGLIVLLLGLAGCAKKGEEAKEAEEPRPVQVAVASRGAIQRVIAAEGILRAIDQSAVTPKISAPVKQFFVNRGDHVRAGQVVAVLESGDLAAAVADAKGAYDQAVAAYRTTSAASVVEELGKAQDEVASAKQALEAAQKLYDSRQDLFKQGALARRLVDEAAVSLAQAKSQSDIAQRHLQSFNSVARQESVNSAAGQRDSAKGKYEASQAQLSYAEIRSPIAGVIAERPVFPGEMANAGTPLLTVMDVSRVIARVNVPQAQAAFVRVGQSAHVVATDNSAAADGKVTVVSPAVDPQSTTVEVWVEAPNPGERLRPGGTVHVTISGDTAPNATLVPPAALFPSQEGGSAVIVIDKDSVAHPHKVQTGFRTADKVQILEGAEPGVRVVVSGGLGLEDGAKVKIEEKKEEKKEDKE